MIAEPDASEGMVTEAVNDTLKAISASLLMEQVPPLFSFSPKNPHSQPWEGFDYGQNGYQLNGNNIGFNGKNGCDSCGN